MCEVDAPVAFCAVVLEEVGELSEELENCQHAPKSKPDSQHTSSLVRCSRPIVYSCDATLSTPWVEVRGGMRRGGEHRALALEPRLWATFLPQQLSDFDTMRQQYGGPKLPADLRNQFGITQVTVIEFF